MVAQEIKDKYNMNKSPMYPEYLEHIEMKKSYNSLSGWEAYYKGRRLPQYPSDKCQGYKITHYYVQVPMKGGLEKHFSVSALVWLCFMKQPIPAGYVIDHIDNNPLNNDPGNLQCITRGDNVRKYNMERWHGKKD